MTKNEIERFDKLNEMNNVIYKQKKSICDIDGMENVNAMLTATLAVIESEREKLIFKAKVIERRKTEKLSEDKRE